MKHPIKFRSLIALGLGLCLSLSALVSCASKPTDSKINAKTVVGTVDGKDVLYDELYFLVNNYLPSVKESVGEDPIWIKAELDRLVHENITANFAILKLCESVELEYDEKEIEEDAENELKSQIALEFDGDKALYKKSLLKDHLTERYVLYASKIDLIYNRLLTHYPQKGLVVSGSDEVRSYIKENFIRTIQFMNPDYEQTSWVYNKIQNGKSMVWAIGQSGYNQDFYDVSGNGYYFCRGMMDEAYENAAFDLKIGEISGIVQANGELEDSYGTCYYIIQRLPLDDTYIQNNLTTLQNQYYGVVIAKDLAQVKGTLSFTPNDFYEELDLTRLPEVYETPSYVPVLIAVGIGAVVLIGAGIVTVILLKKKHAKKNVGMRRAS
ncbi:MAG: hypothetical protein IKA76_08045 [Clostridia bacterium]|nr:hypothetical protein [Clostridia bacterium]